MCKCNVCAYAYIRVVVFFCLSGNCWGGGGRGGGVWQGGGMAVGGGGGINGFSSTQVKCSC